MFIQDDQLRLSATDLANHLACRHLTDLNLAKVHGLAEPPYWYDPMLEVLKKRGDEHERAYLDHLASKGLAHERIAADNPNGFTTARSAMEAGVDAIVQAPLGDDEWRGYADVLLRVEKPSKLGPYSYEVVDTKLARETRGGTILQLCLYTELVAAIQGSWPASMYVVSPGKNFQPEPFRVADYLAYFRMVKRDLAWFLHQRHPGLEPGSSGSGSRTTFLDKPGPGGLEGRVDPRLRGDDIVELYPDPCEHCSICRWWKRCNDIRRDDDHLTFVAGISKSQIRELTDRDVPTLAALARLETPIPWKPTRGSREGIERAHHQARLQEAQRSTKTPVHELLPREPELGLARLPEPSSADIFFDLESARFVGDHGLQYLWGYVGRADAHERHSRESGNLDEEGRYTSARSRVKPGMTSGVTAEMAFDHDWAADSSAEKAAFEHFIDVVLARRAGQPQSDSDLHVYHFGHYEPTTLKQLAQRHGTREEELDTLLRAEVFVDLHSIVRQSLRAGVEQYSLKDLEPFFKFERKMDLIDAAKARHHLERGLELDVPLGEIPDQVRDDVLEYNRDDCLATIGLRDWLEGIRSDLIGRGEEISRPVLRTDLEEDEEREGRRKNQRELADRLLEGIREERDDWTETQQARWLLGHMIQFHWREEKATWWEYFRMRELSDDDLFDEQTAIARLKFVEALPIPKRGRSPIHRYSFPAQESKIREEHKLKFSGGEIFQDDFGDVVAIDYAARTVDIKKRVAAKDIHPTAVFEFSNVAGRAMEDAIFAAGTVVAEEGIEGGTFGGPMLDLLMGHPPRFSDGFRNPIRLPDESGLDAAVRLVLELDGGILPVQGPPGTGKTYIGARMTCALLREGKKVGVVANSHKVIDNFLEKLEEAGREMGVDVKAVHKHDQPNEDGQFITYIDDNKKVRTELEAGTYNVAGGTAWMWSRDDFTEAVDVLFVDEAGQMVLANVLASARGARNVVLLGDPQQLDQPQKGSHPDGVEVSALEHLLAGELTMPDDRGLFLEKTWRLSPPICSYTSELFYRGRLRPIRDLERQSITAGPIGEVGLYFHPVRHEGNQSSSPEEVIAIASLVDALLQPGARWTSSPGDTHVLELKDILVVAPYNAQVSDIAAALPAGARVGTVDKFQGQEAPVVIYSMTTSTREEAPRGMEFLYSLNRLNVATSRARCAVILVANPAVLEPDCRNPRQMKLANAFCRYVEVAKTLQ